MASRAKLRKVHERVDKAKQQLQAAEVARAQAIVEAQRDGVQNTELAEIFDLTPARVGQIANERKKQIEENG